MAGELDFTQPIEAIYEHILAYEGDRDRDYLIHKLGFSADEVVLEDNNATEKYV
jgi:hypothetical protein